MYMPEKSDIFARSKLLVSTSRSRSSGRAVSAQVVHTATHNGTAKETDTNHEQPAGNSTNGEDGVAKGHEQLVLSQPAVSGVESAGVLSGILVDLLGVDLVEVLGGDGGGVHIDDMQWGGQTLLALRLGLGDLVVVDGGSTGGPGSTKNAVVLTVQQTEVGGSRIGREEKDGFLDDDQILATG